AGIPAQERDHGRGSGDGQPERVAGHVAAGIRTVDRAVCGRAGHRAGQARPSPDHPGGRAGLGRGRNDDLPAWRSRPVTFLSFLAFSGINRAHAALNLSFDAARDRAARIFPMPARTCSFRVIGALMSRKATRCAVAAIGTVIAGAVLAGAAPAAAEQHTGEVGTITLCSHGSYASSIKFPNRDGLFTMVVPPGRCEITILRNS